MFIIPRNDRAKNSRGSLTCIASDALGWEHVSVTTQDQKRTPTWAEMCRAKAAFWDPEEAVVQYHPPESEYVDNHPTCLHLWRPVDQEIPRPPPEMVGIMKATVLVVD